MTSYLAAASWGAFILAAMTGLGGILVRALRMPSDLGWAQRATIGFALSAVVGGLLDFLAVVSRPLIVGFLAVGAAELLLRVVRRPSVPIAAARPLPGNRLILAPAYTVIAILLAIRVAGSVIVTQPSATPGSFNVFDDFQAYMVFPLKMVEAGSMGPDPFSIRRTPSHAFGGGAFLQALVVSALPAQSLRLLDVGLGTLLVTGLLWTMSARMAGTRTAAAFLILLFLAVPPPLINITSLLIPTALFLSLFLVFRDPPDRTTDPSRAVLVGVQAAAIGVLKTNLIPAVVAFVGLEACALILRAPSKWRAARTAMSWFGVAGLSALPWMVDAYRWTGTPMPRGLAAYNAHPTRVAAFEAVTGIETLARHLQDISPVPYIVLGTLVGALSLKALQPGRVREILCIAGTAVIGTLAITLAVGGAVNDIERFMYPFLMPAILVAFAQMIVMITALRARLHRTVAYLLVVVSTALLIIPPVRLTAQMYEYSLRTFADAIRGDALVAPALVEKYRAMQSAMQPSRTVLARLDYPFLFDFRRNSILLNDMPGSASLPPGMPFFQGSEPVATYLISHEIRYLAYDYDSQAGTPTTGPLAALANDDSHPSAQAVVRLTFDMHDNIVDLGRRYPHVYDDGVTFVLDLEPDSR